MVNKKLYSNFGKFKKRNSGFFGLRNKFVNVQGNKKRNTQNIQIKNRKKNNHLNCSLWTNQKGLTELITVQWPRAIKPKSQDNWWYY